MDRLHIKTSWSYKTDSWVDVTLTAKKFTKIKFSNDKIYCKSYHRVPNIINVKSPAISSICTSLVIFHSSVIFVVRHDLDTLMQPTRQNITFTLPINFCKITRRNCRECTSGACKIQTFLEGCVPPYPPSDGFAANTYYNFVIYPMEIPHRVPKSKRIL